MLPRPVATLLCVNLYLVTLYSVGEAKLKTNKVAVSELVGDPTQPYNLAEAFFVLNHGFPWPRLVGMLLQIAESWWYLLASFCLFPICLETFVPGGETSSWLWVLRAYALWVSNIFEFVADGFTLFIQILAPETQTISHPHEGFDLAILTSLQLWWGFDLFGSHSPKSHWWQGFLSFWLFTLGFLISQIYFDFFFIRDRLLQRLVEALSFGCASFHTIRSIRL